MQNIVDALQKHGVKKTAVERSLASLVEKGLVKKKEYGKAKIFILSQDKIELPDPEEVTRLDEELKSMVAEVSDLTERNDNLQSTVNMLRSQYTLEQAKVQDEKLTDDLAEKDAKRADLGDGSKLMTTEDKLKLEKDYYNVRALWKKYKRIVTDIVNQIGEATGKKNSELFEDMGIETDESVNIKISDFPDIPNPLKANRFGNTKRAIKRQRQK